MYDLYLVCSWCDCCIDPGEKYLKIGKQQICLSCIEDNLDEFDLEGDEIDMKTDEMIERRINNGNTI